MRADCRRAWADRLSRRRGARIGLKRAYLKHELMVSERPSRSCSVPQLNPWRCTNCIITARRLLGSEATSEDWGWWGLTLDSGQTLRNGKGTGNSTGVLKNLLSFVVLGKMKGDESQGPVCLSTTACCSLQLYVLRVKTLHQRLSVSDFFQDVPKCSLTLYPVTNRSHISRPTVLWLCRRASSRAPMSLVRLKTVRAYHSEIRHTHSTSCRVVPRHATQHHATTRYDTTQHKDEDEIQSTCFTIDGVLRNETRRGDSSARAGPMPFSTFSTGQQTLLRVLRAWGRVGASFSLRPRVSIAKRLD
ncbi:hypothetical protein V8E53_012616 [Lactarius tabidus]